METPTIEIRQAFDGRLNNALSSLGLEADQVAWMNARFTPKVDTLFIRPHIMFGETKTVSIGSDGFERLVGIYQISVFGVKDTGLSDIEEVAKKLIDLFRSGRVLPLCSDNAVTITSAHCSGPFELDDRPHIPVTVSWYCYVQKDIA